MSQEKPNRLKLAEQILKQKRRANLLSFKEYYEYVEAVNSAGFRIELDETLLEEATEARVGRFVARRDPPHFAGDERHGHCDVGGGRAVAWTISGKRRHPSKFPARVPQDAKAAVAKVLRVSVDLLESFWVREGGRKVLLFEVSEQP